MSSSGVSPLAEAVQRTVAASGWTPQQRCYREIMKALRSAYFHDRAKLFWVRHRVLVEFYKYANEPDDKSVQQLVCIGNEIAAFITAYMKMDVERIMRHNAAMLQLPVEKAKRFREDYYLHEKQHESWCKQKVKAMMDRRPPPPYPFF